MKVHISWNVIHNRVIENLTTMSHLNDILLDLQPSTPLKGCLDTDDAARSLQPDAVASFQRRPRRNFIHTVDDASAVPTKRQRTAESTMNTAVTTAASDSNNASSSSTATTRSTELALYQQQWQNLQQSPPNTATTSGRGMEKVRSLRRLYLHGLQTVQKLQDLRHAPDAILPGNFQKH
jgi:hypothetical protein